MDREQLPMDMLADIVVRLPAESVCCIQCVSKALLDTRHTRLLVTTNAVHQVPQLMFFTRSYVPFPGTSSEHYAALQ